GHAQVPIARHRGDDRQTVNRDAVEAAVVDLPCQHRLLADGFCFAVHDAAAGKYLGGPRFDIRARDGALPAGRERSDRKTEQRRRENHSLHVRDYTSAYAHAHAASFGATGPRACFAGARSAKGGKGRIVAETIGFIGLGVMGKPMAGHLVKAGYRLVVHNRSRGAVDELVAAGATAAGAPAAVARPATA